MLDRGWTGTSSPPTSVGKALRNILETKILELSHKMAPLSLDRTSIDSNLEISLPSGKALTFNNFSLDKKIPGTYKWTTT